MKIKLRQQCWSWPVRLFAVTMPPMHWTIIVKLIMVGKPLQIMFKVRTGKI